VGDGRQLEELEHDCEAVIGVGGSEQTREGWVGEACEQVELTLQSEASLGLGGSLDQDARVCLGGEEVRGRRGTVACGPGAVALVEPPHICV